MEEIDSEPLISTKLRIAKNTGFTGLSLLCRLHRIYEFDVLKDKVRGVMHMVPMNCAKKIFSRLIEENIINTELVNERLASFPFSTSTILLQPLFDLKFSRKKNILHSYKMLSPKKMYILLNIIFLFLVLLILFRIF